MGSGRYGVARGYDMAQPEWATLSLTLPGHYWTTLTIHTFKLALGKGLTASYIPVPARRVLHGLYAVWWLAPTLSQARFLTDGKP